MVISVHSLSSYLITAYMMENIGFTNSFIVCSAVMGLNVITGITFKPIEITKNDDDLRKDFTKYTLRIEGK